MTIAVITPSNYRGMTLQRADSFHTLSISPFSCQDDILVSLCLLHKSLNRLVSKCIAIFVKCAICHHITPAHTGKSDNMFLFYKFNHISYTLCELPLCFFLLICILLDFNISAELLLETPVEFDHHPSQFKMVFWGGYESDTGLTLLLGGKRREQHLHCAPLYKKHKQFFIMVRRKPFSYSGLILASSSI